MRYRALGNDEPGRIHIELLLRLIDEHGELVAPGTFLPAAERYNLMPAIDRWVLRAVCSNYHAVAAAFGGAPLTCAVNVSGSTLASQDFLQVVREQALEQRLPPHALCFEVAETAVINQLRKVTEFAREIRNLGFLFALDDFGAGGSSFAYLKNLPVDYLKIDGALVKDIETEPIDCAMTEAINRIAHLMGIKTVAECAQSEAIVRLLSGMGVDYAQGYSVSPPALLLGPAGSGALLAHGDLRRSPGPANDPVPANGAAAAGS
jgi:EAL domain-containing protein (putative c-di-GMP-specific phosphodiesterase class I)